MGKWRRQRCQKGHQQLSQRPSQATARNVSVARGKWQVAHTFNSEDDKYVWLVGLTGLLGGSMCLGVGAGMLE